MQCSQSVISEAKQIWKENGLKSYLQKAINLEEEWWPDHEWDPIWKDTYCYGWYFLMNDVSDLVYFKSPNGEEGEFLITEI